MSRPQEHTASSIDRTAETAPSPPAEWLQTELVLPEDANHYGTLFGPKALALMGKSAFLAAARYSRQPVVMAAANRIDFLLPVPVGALLNLRARVTRRGRSSMSVEVRGSIDAAPGAYAADAMRGEFEMVAVDAHGRPCPLTALAT